MQLPEPIRLLPVKCSGRWDSNPHITVSEEVIQDYGTERSSINSLEKALKCTRATGANGIYVLYQLSYTPEVDPTHRGAQRRINGRGGWTRTSDHVVTSEVSVMLQHLEHIRTFSNTGNKRRQCRFTRRSNCRLHHGCQLGSKLIPFRQLLF